MNPPPKRTAPVGLLALVVAAAVLLGLGWFLWSVPELSRKPEPQVQVEPAPEPEPQAEPEPAPEPEAVPEPEPAPEPQVQGPPPELQLRAPLLCDPGRTCWVSTYFDHDPGPGHQDQACNIVTYDTHGGIDFAIPTLADMERGVTVVASAPGVVLGTRDEMPDVSIKDAGVEGLGGRDCGNGVNVDLGNGWTAQYCHMKLGSVLVQTGDRVEAGTPLGQVGLSGRTEHPHVHIGLRKDGEKIDPYTGTPDGADCHSPATPLWDAETLRDFPYRTGLIRELVLTEGQPDPKQVLAGTARQSEGSVGAEALVLSVQTMADLRDDTIEMTIRDPAGRSVATRTYDQPKVYAFAQIGRKRPEPGWPPGSYIGEVTIRNGAGEITDSRRVTLELR